MAMVIVTVMLVNTLWGKFNLLHQWRTATSPSTLKPEIAPMTEKKKVKPMILFFSSTRLDKCQYLSIARVFPYFSRKLHPFIRYVKKKDTVK